MHILRLYITSFNSISSSIKEELSSSIKEELSSSIKEELSSSIKEELQELWRDGKIDSLITLQHFWLRGYSDLTALQ